ncbi:antitoxin [Janibacter limosus]|uniref:antitoxin n=1 Tax=Janibacter limosus TaxID=53458 RepID=UPI0008345AF6|nr:Rv0909 family putative TA system antitoxin [Janibacter limosus]
MSNNPQQFNGGEYVDKARDAAKGHPDQARSAIDKVQEAANRRTGGKFGSLIDKAGDFVEDKLGLPAKTEPKGEESVPSEPSRPSEPEPANQPSEPTHPTEPPAPQEPTHPTPEPDAAQSDSTGPGKLPG